MWINELSSDGAKNFILAILHHCQFTSVVDDANLSQITGHEQL